MSAKEFTVYIYTLNLCLYGEKLIYVTKTKPKTSSEKNKSASFPVV